MESRSFVFVAVLALASLAACSSGDGSSDESTEEGALSGEDRRSCDDPTRAACNGDAPSIVAGQFKLYREPNARVDEDCDVHTSLDLAASGEAKLDRVILGTCELPAMPDPRAYVVSLERESCGSKVYKGERRVDGRTDQIRITDNRARWCEDVLVALVTVEEIRYDVPQEKLYSKDR